MWEQIKAAPLWVKIVMPIAALFLLGGIASAASNKNDKPTATAGTTTTAEVVTTTTAKATITTTVPEAPTTRTEPTTTPTTTPLPTNPAATAAPQTAPPQTAAPQITAPSSQSCTPGYDPCIPPGPDVDCAGGSGNGPRFVTGPVSVTGPDIYGLDRDGNGIGCE